MADFPNEIRINPAALNKIIIGGIAVALVAIGVYTSFFKVDPREHAIVLRFGEYTGQPITEQGLHFKLPFGIDRHEIVEVTTMQKLEFNFSTQTAGTRTRYASRNRNEAEASLIVTGDLNIADVQWSTQFIISDAYNYLFKVRNAVETFRAMNEAIMREVIGDRTINEVLTSGRGEIQIEVKDKLQNLANQYEMGIKLEEVILQDVNPPQSVRAAWDDVNQAQQERSSKINTAQAQFNKVIPKAKGDAARIIEEANGYAVERVNKAQGDADLFKQVFAAYKQAPEVTRKRIYLETIGKVFLDGPKKIVMDEEAKGLLPLLNLNTEDK